MKYLEYKILGKEKKIKISDIEHNDDPNVIERDGKHYEYKVCADKQKTFKKLLKILKLWNELTKESGVEYWACGGTLLGAVRHSGFIPWDNDADCSIMLSDLKKVKRNLDKHPVLKYYESVCGLRLHLDDNDSTAIDVFICDWYNKFTVNFCGPLSDQGESMWWNSEIFPNQHIHMNELRPLKEVAFEDATIMIPNNATNVLYRNFSDQCLSECKISNHVVLHEGIFNSKMYQEGQYEMFKRVHDVDKFFNISKKNSLNMLQSKVANKILHSNSKFLNNPLIKKLLNNNNLLHSS